MCEDKSRYFKNTLYLYRCLRAKQLLRASELMRAAYHEKEVQFNPIKDNQRPTATRDEYLLLFWWLNGSTEGLRLRLFSIKKTRNWSLTKNHIVEGNIVIRTLAFANDNTGSIRHITLWLDFVRMKLQFLRDGYNLPKLIVNTSHIVWSLLRETESKWTHVL